MKVLYAGDVLPADSTSGAKVLYRHLRLLASSHPVTIAHWDQAQVPGCQGQLLPVRALARYALASRRRRHWEALDAIVGLRVADRHLAHVARTTGAEVLVTVAQGGLCHNARRVAARLGLPLATFFHDWSPDWRDHPHWAAGALDRSFRGLYRASACPLCISEEIRVELGNHPDAVTLLPIPEPKTIPAMPPPPAPAGATLTYAGVLNGLYEHEMLRLGGAALAQPRTPVLTFFGPHPHWGDPIGQQILTGGMYRGMLDSRALRAALTASAALLVVLPFGENHRRFSRCSFSSKISEYCSVGRPIIVWGPAYSSGVRWAEASGAALVVTDPNPRELLRQANELLADPARQFTLASRALAEAGTRFNPQRLQSQFEAALFHAAGRTS